MGIDWDQVKSITLWHYEDLITKLLEVLEYGFIQEHYNHSMVEAANFSLRVRQGYRQHGKEAAFIGEITDHFIKLGDLGVGDYLDLVQQVETREKCEIFLQRTGCGFEALIQTLNYLFRWVLPFKCPAKELVDAANKNEIDAVEGLRKSKIRSNLDVLEICRTRASRRKLAKETGVAETWILGLAHRADITRLAYVRGKTVKHLCGGGYDTLDKIALAELTKMEEDMATYYRTIGKRSSDFTAVIPLDWMIGGAKILPRLIEN